MKQKDFEELVESVREGGRILRGEEKPARTFYQLAAIKAKLLSGNEALHQNGNPTELTVQDFWKWAYSDLLSNSSRAVFAEYLVASALGIQHTPREAWKAYDLDTADGTKIEVKCSAYVQSWFQKDHSKIGRTLYPGLHSFGNLNRLTI